MCGIAGILGRAGSLNRLEAMLKAQSHRGPDNQGEFLENGKIALGHNRLSIIDLSEAGNQPFFSPDHRFCIIFNGEIYNYLELRADLAKSHHFRTGSDTEVLLQAYIQWGVGCLDKLNGMFAFAIWDKVEEKLFAARDRFGVKPFYYSDFEDSFFFASEIPALFAGGIEKTPKQSVWASFFSKGVYGMPDETFWDGVYQLPAGSYLEISKAGKKISQWYFFVEAVKNLGEVSHKDEEDYILQLMRDSIKLRFRADVPVGFNLSGGLDSSTLLALVSAENPGSESIKAFTFYTEDERYDELPWVKEMISKTNFPLNTCLLTASEVPELTRRFSALQMEPFGGIPTLAYGKVFERAREKGVLVLLDGQGADESWAGYDYYFQTGNSIVQGVKSSPVKADSLRKDFLGKAEYKSFPEPFSERLLNLQYRDLFYTKIPRALRFNDRMSMAYSTELREPFLDYRLVEYAFSRPENFKRKNGVQKYALRQIANKFLGDSITLAPKRPLQTPQREWLGGELKDWSGDRIQWLAEHSSWFDKKVMLDYWDRYLKGENDNSFYIWQWINSAEILYE
ncbi:asparagine synthase (glutamine-hydrolyzing) [Algoriphagus namhaensis]|uniref:asparagine synthase (glutamine-hydrolyzing) n=1 Tax=Algoriphagus namhaensis TaxID=915353 RepID=A0ABV8AT79_9BACT